MSSWVDDHFSCAPLPRWLPAWSSTSTTRTVVVGRPPGRLAGLLAALDGAGTTHVGLLVCAAALSDRGDVLATELRARATTGGSPGDVQVVDLAWLSSWRARVGLWSWRREPVRRAMAQRLARLADGGLDRLQQWVCLAPAPCVVTLGRLRADAS